MSRSDLISPSRMLPDITLPDRTGAARRVRANGDRSVLLALIHGGCEECRSWVAKLAEEGAEIITWKSEVKIVAARVAEYPFPVLLDPDARLAALVGVAVPAVVIADQWGAIHEATEGHEFIPIESVVEWIRYLATECPECEGEAY